MKDEIEKILKDNLFNDSHCPFCSHKNIYGKVAGMAIHVKVQHPEKYISKADKILSLFEAKIDECLPDITHHLFLNKTNKMARALTDNIISIIKNKIKE